MPRRVNPSKAPGLAQIRAHERIARLRTDKFSPTMMIFTWIVFLSLHFVCFLYFATASWCYWKLPNTRLDAWLSMLYIGMGTEYHRLIALVHAFIAVVHAAYVIWMIGWSCWKNDVVFAVYNVFKLPSHLDGAGDDLPVIPYLKNGIFWIYRGVFTRDGFLGVDGPNFDFVLLCREILETALQTQQAYRMSQLLPRTNINRGYAALLVLNCWTTALVHFVYHDHATRRRLLALVCDCILDLVSSVGITVVLVSIYVHDFDFAIYGFPFLKWYEDVWRVHAMNEFQMILVSSWGDLVMRFVFAMSMLGNLNNMKKLVRARPSKPRKVGTKGRHRATVVAPFHASFANVKKNLPNFDGVDTALLNFWVAKFTEIGFFVWGLMILVVHLHAESITELPQCTMQVKPWSSSRPSCSLLELNCYESGFEGRTDEIVPLWNMFDPTTVVRVVVRHCNELELPDTLTKFSHLKELKIYNSTITTWDSSAAITQANHPKLTTLFLIRVNMTDGELPLGLQDFDFPQSLEDIEFCVTNLRSLPEDLDLKWPQYASIYLEASEFVEVPSSLISLAPYDLSMSMNPISTIPKELFESESVAFLSFGGTLVSELPSDVVELASSLYEINLSNTNISFFWSWIDPLVVVPATTPPITAGNTPYCYAIQRVFENTSGVFSFPYVNLGNEASILANTSMSNWHNLKNAVSCEVEISTYYPLEFEDVYKLAFQSRARSLKMMIVVQRAGQAAPSSDDLSPNKNPIESAFSPLILRLCWFCFVTLHVFCGLYFTVMAIAYSELPNTTFGRWLYFYDLGLDPEYDEVISIVYGCIAAIHVGYLIWMLVWSLYNRSFVFAVYNVFGSPTPATKATEKRLTHTIWDSYRAFLLKMSLLGVDGPYFDLLLFCRETLETALQTHQAYRMSLLLPRSELNRVYVGLLVLNCWSTTVVHSVFHGSYTKRRFYAIASDCILDLVTSVGISIALLTIYLPDFDFQINDFPVHKWYEDVWMMHVISKFQILLVTSWGDLVMRVIFALSMVINMNNMKKLLSTAIPDVAESRRVSANRRLSAVLPRHPSLGNMESTGRPNKLRMAMRMESRLTQTLFLAWGILILCLHTYAESIIGPHQCRMQVKPWFISDPACSLMVLDCYKSNITGVEDEVIAQWSSFDPTSTSGVVIHHCTNFEMPDFLREFSNLKLLKFYNSTILSWTESAAITQTHHPNLIMLFLVRVTLPDGQLPAGMHATDFPRNLGDIEICHTNLRTLPDDIDTKWSQLASIYIEACNFTEVPASLARLAPYDLSLAMNSISKIPAKLLEGGMVFLHIGATAISKLPKNVEDASALEQIRVDNTEISFFWDWIDPVIENAGAVLSDVPSSQHSLLFRFRTHFESNTDGVYSSTVSTAISLFI